jgi:Fic family protein
MTAPENTRRGRYVETRVAGEAVRAYVPSALPPSPPIDVAALQPAIDRANHALGRLDGIAPLLPDKDLFLYGFVRKEALLSSQIEGTQSSFADLLAHEDGAAPGVPIDDVEEVSNYVAALNHGVRRLRGGFPLSLRLLREVHAILLRGARGASRHPGEFRRTQNWIGGSRPGRAVFVPPPPNELGACLDAFENFLHDDATRLPDIVKAGLAHVQFETIHPFLDGNGRLGRLMIALMLLDRGLLREPVLYLSLHFKALRREYYDHLQSVRLAGAWEAWLAFFLEGVAEVANQAVATVHRGLGLFEKDRRRLSKIGAAAKSAVAVHAVLCRKPVATIAALAEETGLAFATVNAAVRRMRGLNVVREITGRRRERVFAYGAYLDILAEGTEPLPR